MIKKWVFAAIAYLLVVIIGFTIYNSIAEPEPMKMEMNMNMNMNQNDGLIVDNK